MSELKITAQADQLLVIGSLTREQVTHQFEKQAYQLISNDNAIINLRDVDAIDTAGLAWLLAMLEKANSKKITLELAEIPAKLENLAKLSGVAAFLPAK